MAAKRIRYVLWGLLLLALFTAGAELWLHTLGPNTRPDASKAIYLRSNAGYPELLDQLRSTGLVRSVKRFDRLARQLDLHRSLRPGKYVIDKRLSNIDLVRKFRNGDYEVQVIKLGAEMDRDSLVNYLATSLEADIAELKHILASSWAEDNGFTSENLWCIFLPDHYHFNWATTAQGVIDRFYKEYRDFWNTDRLGRAYKLDLSAEEACILATIVDGEAIHTKEMPTIAGLYLNRLKRGMPLQSDPTAMFVNGTLQRRRALYSDIRKPHAYNTYVISGLPPGPILFPDKRAIEAVLNAEEHKYLFMCAIGDGSYLHNFAETGREHERNVRLFRKNRRNQ